MNTIAEMLEIVKASCHYGMTVHLSRSPNLLTAVPVDPPSDKIRYTPEVSPWYIPGMRRASAVLSSKKPHDSLEVTWGGVIEQFLRVGHLRVQPMRYEGLNSKTGQFEVMDYAKDSVPLFNLVKSAGPRRTESIESYYAVMLDVDSGEVTFDEAEAIVLEAGLECLGYTSYSHTPGKHKYRLVILLAAPVKTVTMLQVTRQLTKLFKGDKSCKDNGRYFYVPSCPADATDARMFYCPGEPLSMARVSELVAADNADLPAADPKAGQVQKSHKKGGGRYNTLPEGTILYPEMGDGFDLYGKTAADFEAADVETWKRVFPFCHQSSGPKPSAFCSWNEKRGCAQVTCASCEKTWFASKRASTDDIDWPVTDKFGRMQTTHRDNVFFALDMLGYSCSYDTACNQLSFYKDGVLVKSESDVVKNRLLSELLNFGFGLNIARVHLETWYAGNEFNSVQQYLTSVEWDGVDRVSALAAALNAKSEGAEDYIMKWLVGGVAVVLRERGNNTPPMVLTLMGPQGIGKTTFGKLLTRDVPHLFCEGASFDASDTTNSGIRLGSNWVIELGEVGSTMARSNFDSLKALITREVDKYRPLYKGGEVERPRRCILYATVNEEQFIRDNCEPRRWWVIETDSIDLQAIEAMDMRQLWAQAKAYYDAGVEWYYQSSDPTIPARNARYVVEGAAHATVGDMFVVDLSSPGMNSEAMLRALYGSDRMFTSAEKQAVGYACRAHKFPKKHSSKGAVYLVRCIKGQYEPRPVLAAPRREPTILDLVTSPTTTEEMP